MTLHFPDPCSGNALLLHSVLQLQGRCHPGERSGSSKGALGRGAHQPARLQDHLPLYQLT